MKNYWRLFSTSSQWHGGIHESYICEFFQCQDEPRWKFMSTDLLKIRHFEFQQICENMLLRNLPKIAAESGDWWIVESEAILNRTQFVLQSLFLYHFLVHWPYFELLLLHKVTLFSILRLNNFEFTCKIMDWLILVHF